jgi:uncharacterized protein
MATNTNPFVYGEIVPLTSFVDREVELERLVADLRSGQKIFLISPRRYGKSSLVRQALRISSRQGALTVEVTVSSYSSYVAFLEGYARALVSAETRLERVRSWLRDMLRGVRPEVRLESSPDGKGKIAVSFPAVRSDRDIAHLAEQVFALPGRIAEARGLRMAISLDEFQGINEFNGGSVEHAMRAAVQQQRNVGYVFAGSEPTLMERMLGKSRPFYKAGPVMRLEKIPADRFATFIESRFRTTGIKPEAGLGAAVVELAGNLPYDVQRLAHELWDDVKPAGRRSVTIDDLHDTLKRLLGEHETLFESTWQRLPLTQRAALRATVLEEGRGLLSADVRTRHRLSVTSTLQQALSALVKHDILAREGTRYAVVDSLFREWVARRTF